MFFEFFLGRFWRFSKIKRWVRRRDSIYVSFVEFFLRVRVCGEGVGESSLLEFSGNGDGEVFRALR